jgi:hypothetical protein
MELVAAPLSRWRDDRVHTMGWTVRTGQIVARRPEKLNRINSAQGSAHNLIILLQGVADEAVKQGSFARVRNARMAEGSPAAMRHHITTCRAFLHI